MTDRRGWGRRLHPYRAQCSPGTLLSHTNHCYPHQRERFQRRDCCRALTEIALSPCRFPLIPIPIKSGFSSSLFFPPSGSWELTEPRRHPALPSLSARSSTYSSRLLRRERCGFALSLFAALRARETCSCSEKDRSAPVSSWFVLRSTL